MTSLRARLFLTVIAGWVAAAVPAVAHHSFAMFDHAKILTLDGTVKEFKWENPHVWIQVLAPQTPGGPVVEWSVEGASVNILVRNGWSGSVIKPGDKVEVVINPLRSGAFGGSLTSMKIGTKTLFAH